MSAAFIRAARRAGMANFAQRIAVVVVFVGCAGGRALGQRTITADAYLDKMRGMWLGQLIGNMTGLPTEGVYNLIPNPNSSVPWSLNQIWTTDDDTDVEYLIQHAYLEHGFELTATQLRDEWVAHIPILSVYVANRRARWLMQYGMFPDETGSYQRNEHWWSIDPQLTTESIGAISPGKRQWALDHVRTWARVTSEGSTVHAAQFYAAMYSAATFESDIPTLLQRGLECIPQSSRASQVVRDVIAWHAADMADGVPDWRGTRLKLFDYYMGAHSFGRSWFWLDSSIDLGATTLALLYGAGDYEQTVQIAVLAGWDCDCNASTAGGLIGMILGYAGMPTSLTSQCGDVYRNTDRTDLPQVGPLPQDDSIIAIAQRWQTLAEQAIVLNGGTISGSGAARMYTVPTADPVTPEPEQWDPAGAAGLVGAFRARGESVSLSASVVRHNAALDRENIEGIADGITDPRYTAHRPYWTSDGDPNQPPGGDFYQIGLPGPARVNRVVFYAGDLWLPGWNSDPMSTAREGGYFVTLAPEVLQNGQWSVPPGVIQSEPLNATRPFQVIAFDFPGQWCEGIRVRGEAGGSAHYTTIMELEAYGYAALSCDLNCDGSVNQFDIGPFVLALGDPASYSTQFPACRSENADANDDGSVNQFDIQAFIECLSMP